MDNFQKMLVCTKEIITRNYCFVDYKWWKNVGKVFALKKILRSFNRHKDLKYVKRMLGTRSITLPWAQEDGVLNTKDHLNIRNDQPKKVNRYPVKKGPLTKRTLESCSLLNPIIPWLINIFEVLLIYWDVSLQANII